MSDILLSANLGASLPVVPAAGSTSRSTESSGGFDQVFNNSFKGQDPVKWGAGRPMEKSVDPSQVATPSFANQPVTPVTAKAVEAPLSGMQSNEAVDSLEHRQALLQLLKKMREDFGIDAIQIVQAFASLTPEQLQLPPEQNIDAILQSLQIPVERRGEAKKIFGEMLARTSPDTMGDYLKASRRQISLEVMSNREAQRQQLNRSLDQMQKDFFVKRQPDEQKPDNGLMNTSATANTEMAKTSEGGKSIAGLGLMPVRPETAILPATVPSMAPPMTSAASSFSNLSDQTIPAGEMGQTKVVAQPLEMNTAAQADTVANADSSAAALTKPPANYQHSFESQMAAVPVINDSAIPGQASTDAATPNWLGESSQAVAAMNSESAMANSDNGNEAQLDQGGEEGWQHLQGHNQAERTQLNSLKGESFVVPTHPTPEQQSANVRELVDKAQFMAQKGGGEMKVSLSPEGLGQVNMKVMVQNGQVNVEMITESSEAKKILEKGLGDLKANLLSHNLRVDQVKVDTAADVSRQLTQQHDEAQRQFAQQFMEQFRQDNNEWRRGFYDIGGAKVYRSQRDAADADGGQIQSSSRRKDQSRRLDLVA